MRHPIAYFWRSALLLSALAGSLAAQQNRITGAVDRLQIRELKGNIHPKANPRMDAGRLIRRCG